MAMKYHPDRNPEAGDKVIFLKKKRLIKIYK